MTQSRGCLAEPLRLRNLGTCTTHAPTASAALFNVAHGHELANKPFQFEEESPISSFVPVRTTSIGYFCSGDSRASQQCSPSAMLLGHPRANSPDVEFSFMPLSIDQRVQATTLGPQSRKHLSIHECCSNPQSYHGLRRLDHVCPFDENRLGLSLT